MKLDWNFPVSIANAAAAAARAEALGYAGLWANETPHHAFLPLAALRPYGFRLAGEVADGVHVHSFATVPYLKEVALPALQEGLEKSGRERSDVQLAAALFVCVGDDRAAIDAVRTQIAFYGSTS